jgi:putative thioredoxin
MGQAAAVSEWIIDVNEQTFQSAVIERSREVPVVVDFWATWCGPCRSLGPILENLAQEYGGRFILARLNVDENQRLSAQYNIQGIPAVKGFRDGQVAAEFVGALPKPSVRQFVDRLLPNELDLKVAGARALLAAGKPAEAEAGLRTILAENADQPAALLGLAQALVAQDRMTEALALLERVPPATPEGAEAARLRMAWRLRAAAAGASEVELNARIAEAPGDLVARYKLGCLLAGAERYQEALDQFLEVVRRDRAAQRNQAREAMVYLFDVLGEDPLARSYRNRLASVLFA